MLFPDIKNYFIESEEEKNHSEEYLVELEESKNIEDMIAVVMDYHNHIDEFESSNYILTKVCL